MQLVNDQWLCTYCGNAVDGIGLDARPVAFFHGTSGKPTQRVVTVDGLEVHRCEGQVNARREVLYDHARETRSNSAALRVDAQEARARATALVASRRH
ncbi:MAG TPA: hypothetical protein VGO03_11915 [Acidimicrobiia bacterium]|jgi:hypothetical protein